MSRIITHRQQGPVPVRCVALAGSAGGLSAFTGILSALPPGFPAPVLALLHLDPHHKSHLADVLRRETSLPVLPASEGLRVQPGVVYVAVPNLHLEIDAGQRLHLGDTPRVHFVRPSADLLFASVARVYGPGAVGVLCSGSGRDGVEGLALLRGAGGRVLVQDPTTCRCPAMPQEAINHGVADEVLTVPEMGPRLVQLVAPAGIPPASSPVEWEE